MLAHRLSSPVLCVPTVEVQMTELTVGHEVAVDEKGTAYAGAKGDDCDDASDPFTGAIANLRDPSGVGIVDDSDLAFSHRFEERIGVDSDPCLVNVGRGLYSPAAN